MDVFAVIVIVAVVAVVAVAAVAAAAVLLAQLGFVLCVSDQSTLANTAAVRCDSTQARIEFDWTSDTDN